MGREEEEWMGKRNGQGKEELIEEEWMGDEWN